MNQWQFMFAVGGVLTLAVIAVFLVIDLPHELVWRVTLGLGAVPALIILLLRHRATIYGWISCFAQGSEFSTFAFYLPVLFVTVGVSSILGTDLVTMALYVIAAISGWIAPMITPKIGQRGISIAGFGSRSPLPRPPIGYGAETHPIWRRVKVRRPTP